MLVRVVSFLLSQDAGGDALARVQLTAQWLQNPMLRFHFDVWLPLHFWMTAALSILVGDVEVGCRILSLVLGTASVGAIWLLANELDGVDTAIISTIVFAFYSLHIAYSVTSSCDVPYLFFAIAGMALFFCARRAHKESLFLSSGLLLTVGAGIRYEAWIIIFALNAILLFRRQFRALSVFLPASGAWPVFWMIHEWVTLGHPLYSPALNYSYVAQDLSFYGTSLRYRLSLPVVVSLITLTPLAVLGAICSVPWILKKRGPLAEFAFVFFFYAAIQFYQIAAGGTMSYARYTLTLGTMTAVLAGVGLSRVFPYRTIVSGVMVTNLVLLTLLGSIDNPWIDKIRSVSPVLHFVSYLEDTGEYLRHRLGENDAVIIDNYNYEANQLAVLAGMPVLGSERAFLIADRVNPEKQKQTFAEVFPYLRARRPSYLVYADQGELRAFLPLPADCATAQVEDIHFACVFHNSKYQIYQIRYPG